MSRSIASTNRASLIVRDDSEDIRRHVAAQTDAEGMDAFSVLAQIGRECIGALQFLPDGVDPGPAGVVAGEPVNDERIAAIITDLNTAPL
jgi:serine/threonine-protein kinase HipA